MSLEQLLKCKVANRPTGKSNKNVFAYIKVQVSQLFYSLNYFTFFYRFSSWNYHHISFIWSYSQQPGESFYLLVVLPMKVCFVKKPCSVKIVCCVRHFVSYFRIYLFKARRIKGMKRSDSIFCLKPSLEIISTNPFQGWEYVFYIQGGSCFLWVAAWWILASDSPATHPRISKTERAYIEDGKFVWLGRLVGLKKDNGRSNGEFQRWPQSTIESILALHPVVQRSILSIPRNFCQNVAEIYWRDYLEQ